MSVQSVALFAAILSTGLVAGVLYGWVVSVLPGLARVDDRTFVSTMQHINVAIFNPGFLVPFVLTPAILGAAALVFWATTDGLGAMWLFLAAVIYLLGVLGVTIGGNIPLNDNLETFDMAKTDESAISAQRVAFEGPWRRWHGLRTIASIVSLACAVLAALTY